MGSNPSHYTRERRGAPTHPVEQVSWKEAVAFCRKLSARAEEKSRGRTYRLPTEAEWEYACRGGATGSPPFFYGNSLTPTHANFATKAPSGYFTMPVGTYRPNAFGLYDMHGNVWEWCQDWYGENYYTRSPRRDPQGPREGRSRVLRGGSWVNSRSFCRSAARGTFEPDSFSMDIGFRVVCSLKT